MYNFSKYDPYVLNNALDIISFQEAMENNHKVIIIQVLEEWEDSEQIAKHFLQILEQYDDFFKAILFSIKNENTIFKMIISPPLTPGRLLGEES